MKLRVAFVPILEQLDSYHLLLSISNSLLPITEEAFSVADEQPDELVGDVLIELRNLFEERKYFHVDKFERVKIERFDEILLELNDIDIFEAGENVVAEGTEDIDHGYVYLVEFLASLGVAEQDEGDDLALLN